LNNSPDPGTEKTTLQGTRRTKRQDAAAVQCQGAGRAPNVVIILIDDLGFGATETFGGPIATPTLDRLSQNGLRYNNFHTAALSSPTRAALKTGRNTTP
jgi:arylsulfatase A-like enzyme